MDSTFKVNLFATILLIIFIIGNIVTAFIPGFDKLPLVAMLVLPEIILLIIPTIIYFIITKAPVKKTLRLNWPGWLTVFYSFSFALFVQPAMMFLSALSGLFFKNDVSQVIASLSSVPAIILIIVIGLTPAICEEIPLRGVLLSGYDKIDIKKAMLINGLFFGIIHLNLQQFLYAFALGAVFAYMVRLTNSIIPSMIAHFTINSTQVLFQKLVLLLDDFDKTQVDATALVQQVTFHDKLMLLASVFTLAVFITPIAAAILYGLRNYYKNTGKNNNIEPTNNYSYEKVLNWPVGLSIGIYIVFTLFILFIQFLIPLMNSIK